MDNVELLTKVFFFKDLTSDELSRIAALTEVVSYHIGQKVFEEGSPSDAIYVIKSGSVMVKRGAIVLATPGTGDPVGEMSFIDRGQRSATVTAIDDTELLVVPCDDLEALFESEPRMAAKIYKAVATVLSLRLRDMSERMGTSFKPSKF